MVNEETQFQTQLPTASPVPQPAQNPEPPTPPTPPIEPVVVAPVTQPQKIPGLKMWLLIGGGLLVLGVGGAVAMSILGIGGNKERKPSKEFMEAINAIPTAPPITPWAYNTPEPTPLPKTIAPSGTPEFKLKNYRSMRATIVEAQAAQERIEKTFGSIVIPSNLEFVHSEVYKGIPIKWTKNQPIPADRLEWIKSAIDTLPDFFIVDHPVTDFISASEQELGLKSSPSLIGAAAYASGLNIFFTNRILKDSVLGAATKKDIVFTLFHEWVHIVQHYEILQTFNEEYLSFPSNLIVVMKIVPFNKDFARAAGWVFQDDTYGDSSYGILGTDVESQKTTDYGKTSYIEDLADSAASVIACDTAKISQDRIFWIEKNFTKRPAASFCPAKF